MFETLDIFKTAHAVAKHAAQRQSVVAANVANADTPGFKARDVVSFEMAMRGAETNTQIRATRPNHISSSSSQSFAKTVVDRNSENSPNGNSVSIETEMLKSIEAERQHSRAMTVYQTSMGILRTSLGRGR